MQDDGNHFVLGGAMHYSPRMKQNREQIRTTAYRHSQAVEAHTCVTTRIKSQRDNRQCAEAEAPQDLLIQMRASGGLSTWNLHGKLD